MYVCLFVFMYNMCGCEDVSMCVCEYVCACVIARARTHTHTHTHTHFHVCTLVYTHVRRSYKRLAYAIVVFDLGYTVSDMTCIYNFNM